MRPPAILHSIQKRSPSKGDELFLIFLRQFRYPEQFLGECVGERVENCLPLPSWVYDCTCSCEGGVFFDLLWAARFIINYPKDFPLEPYGIFCGGLPPETAPKIALFVAAWEDCQAEGGILYTSKDGTQKRLPLLQLGLPPEYPHIEEVLRLVEERRVKRRGRKRKREEEGGTP